MTRRDLWNSAIIGLCFIAGMHITDRVIAGIVQCHAFEACPFGGAR